MPFGNTGSYTLHRQLNCQTHDSCDQLTTQLVCLQPAGADYGTGPVYSSSFLRSPCHLAVGAGIKGITHQIVEYPPTLYKEDEKH